MNFREFVENPSYQLSDLEVANAYLHNHDLSIKQLSEKANRSVGEIYRILKRNGSRPNRMIKNHDNVHMFSDSGLPLTQIASLTGYTTRNVRYILNQ